VDTQVQTKAPAVSKLTDDAVQVTTATRRLR